jgi:NAD(P) transhydrogenase subunit beta
MEVLIPIYFVASFTFILGLKMLSHPETARKGNWVAGGRNGTGYFRHYLHL